MKDSFIYGSKYLVAEIFEKTFIITSKENNHLDVVSYHDLIKDLQDLINQINANPPIFEDEVSEGDQILFLQILNKLRKNNKTNLSEDELEELALLQFKRENKKSKDAVREVLKEEVKYNDSIIPSYDNAPPPPQKKGRDWGEMTRILTVEKTVTPTHETFNAYKLRGGAYGITYKGNTTYIDDLSEEMVNQIVSEGKPIPFGSIREMPKMLTKEALQDETMVAKINGDVVQITPQKRENNPIFESLKNIGGQPR